MSWMSTPAMRSREAKVWRKSFQRKSLILARRSAGLKTRPTKCLPSSGPVPSVFGKTHRLLRREGRARSTAAGDPGVRRGDLGGVQPAVLVIVRQHYDLTAA